MIETGTVSRIFKQVPYSFTAFAFLDEYGAERRAVGKTMPIIVLGETLKMEGKYIDDAKWGKQFIVERIHTEDPKTEKEIRDMLVSGKIPSITPTLADQIVNRFGADTLKILDNDISKLKLFSISTKRYNTIKMEWTIQRKYESIALFFAKYKVPADKILGFVELYGDNTIKRVTENPYDFMTKVENENEGLSFAVCDKIAEDLKIEKTADIRINAAIRYILMQDGNNGNVFMSLERLDSFLTKLLGFKQDIGTKNLMAQNIIPLIKDGYVIFDQDRNRLYLAEYYNAECKIAEKLLSFTPPNWMRKLSKYDMEIIENKIGLQFGGMQKGFLTGMHQYGCQILTGGPGTGKTTLLRGVVEGLHLMKKDVVIHCLAPTGRAAKKMQETIGIPAKTIHKEIRAISGIDNEKDYVPPDVLIVDEMSMVNLLIFCELLDLSPATAIILVGDSNQLSAVGPGDILKDIISSKKIPVCKLNRIHRQEKGSAIIDNSYQILAGCKTLKYDNEFRLLERERANIVDDTVSLFMKALKTYNLMDVQIIVPMKKTAVSTTEINHRIQDLLHSSGPEINVGYNKVFRVGDKVMETHNHYSKKVVNGDIGIITQIVENIATIDFNGEIVDYNEYEMSGLLLAYAITVHKAQGSEYPVVIYPISMLHSRMLKRNLFYTAVTRAKNHFIMIGEREAIDLAIESNDNENRQTTLRERLGA